MQAIEIEVEIPRATPAPCRPTSTCPTASTPSNKAPAILTSNGFGGNKDDEGQVAAASAFAKAGYVAISYSGLGFGESNCKIYLDDRDYDGKAGKQIVDVLAGTKAYTDEGTPASPKTIDYVATDGRRRPQGRHDRRLLRRPDPVRDRRAGRPRSTRSSPSITWNDLSYSLAPNNTIRPGRHLRHPGVAKKQWIDLFFGAGIVSGLQNTTTTADPETAGRLPELRRRGCAGGSPAEHRRLPRPRHPGARPARLGRQLPEATSRSRRCWCRDRTTPCSTSRRPSRPTAR